MNMIQYNYIDKIQIRDRVEFKLVQNIQTLTTIFGEVGLGVT
jgi:hypothetical protein